MADVDEALVQEVAEVIERGWSVPGWTSEQWALIATEALAHLAATGRLVGEGEERVEWGYHPDDVGKWSLPRLRRTVRTWTTPDGATGTLVGPWVEVEG